MVHYIGKYKAFMFFIFSFLSLATLHLLGKAKFYNEFLYFDKFMHFSVGLWMSWAIYIAITRIYGDTLKNFTLYLLTFSLLVTIGVFWEFYEFLVDNLIIKNPLLFSQKSIADTMADLLFDMFGSMSFIAIILFKNRKKRPL